MKGRIRSAFLFVIMLTSNACENETYSNYAAYFVCEYTHTIPQLNAAMNGLGVFCTIQASGAQYIYKDAHQKSTAVNITEIDKKRGYHMGLSGFIVGLPNMPELGSSTSTPVCYDLACPNCYRDYHITKDLKLKDSGFAECISCQRSYNLNNQGNTNNGKALNRYRITYSGNTVIINNR